MRIIEYHDIKTLLGPCFVSFSLPLLVPGVVLTVVGTYGNENTFPLFGAWHITGIVMLSIAVIMLFSGIILKCCYRPIISADIEEHLSPTSSMITGQKNLGYDDEIYSSKRAQTSNKVGHHDMNNSHTVVSTHEAKQTSTTRPNSQFLANSAIAENQAGRPKEETARASTETTQSSGVKSTSSSSKTQPPPSYDRIQAETRGKETKGNTTGVSVVKTTQGNVTTKVTATITAEAETARASGSRDQSSDANEDSK